jgi:hypothetical protein
MTCIGCHEPRNTAPRNAMPLAAHRRPSAIQPGPEGSWPLDYRRLVQPVLDRHCVACHKPAEEAESLLLTADHSYDVLVDFGHPSLRTHVVSRHRRGRSVAGWCAARTSPLAALLKNGHYDVQLAQSDWERLVTWMDTYAQRLGSFSDQQEDRLRELRSRMTAMSARPPLE